ncbi:MAG: IS4 family transposase [Leptospiraceae bacterium]|nr:IS4 family transposase [Leptospiraceae bacterium]
MILKSHKNSTINRLKDKEIILGVQDTTEIAYSGLEDAEGLGYINHSETAKGYYFHPTIAVTVEGTPLGILDSQVWIRESLTKGKTEKEYAYKKKHTPIEQKESYKWLKSYRTLCEIETNNHKDFHLVSVCDREADIFELFYEHAKITNENKPDLIVRAKANRIISDGAEKYLFDELNNNEIFAEYNIIVPRKKGVQIREATLQVKFKEVTIEPPSNLINRNSYSKIKLYAVTTNEINPPKDVDPIHWFILTTIPVLNFDDAFEIIQWYRQRWVIEIFFKTLKSGCNIEKYQFHTFERLKKILAIDSIIAWRILFLTTFGRECPDLPASILFEEHEWKALHARIYMTKNVPNEVPSISVVMRQIGQLGRANALKKRLVQLDGKKILL